MQAAIIRAVGSFLSGSDIDALLARRDAILARLARLGESALFDRPAR